MRSGCRSYYREPFGRRFLQNTAHWPVHSHHLQYRIRLSRSLYHYKKRNDIISILPSRNKEAAKEENKEEQTLSEKEKRNLPSYKLLDTSVIIDGRIADICKTGFIEGTLLIPVFVLEELQFIADSSDLLKRTRGRRGLDILKRIQTDFDMLVEIDHHDYDDISGVDSKLIRLGQEIGAKIITNDFNLNKVAELQGVQVLNINELANAIKPVVIPGETMVVTVVKMVRNRDRALHIWMMVQ